MVSLTPISPAYVALTLVVVAAEILLPLLLGVVAARRLGVGWRYFGIGALIFFLSQIVIRLPLIQVVQVVIAPLLRASPAALWAWLAVAALTAGLFESVGRYLGFRWLSRRETLTWPKAVMMGLGHGGIESMLLIAGLTLLMLVNVVALASGGLAQLPPEQRAVAEAQLTAIAAQPAWLPLAGLWERACAIAFHVAMSVVVLQVFRRGQARWLWLAVAAHGLFDFLAVALLQLLGRGVTGVLVTEGALAIGALAALWVIRRLRDGYRVMSDG